MANGRSSGSHAYRVSGHWAPTALDKGDPMSTSTVHQVTVSTRTLRVTVAAVLVAIALAISLPLALRGTHTVFVRTGPQHAATSTGTSQSSVTTDSQTRIADDTPTGPAMTDSQTRMGR